MIALRAGARMQEHKADQCVTIHVLEGGVRVHLPQEALDLPQGTLLALEQTVLHDVGAIADSVSLLTLGWSRR